MLPPAAPSRAFTLVEIMVVVVIIGLLAAMALPAFQRVRERSLASRMANDIRQCESAFQRYALAEFHRCPVNHYKYTSNRCLKRGNASSHGVW